MRALVCMVVIAGLNLGCKAVPRSGAHADWEQDGVAGEMLAYAGLDPEHMRHWAAVLILLLIGAGVWLVVRDHVTEGRDA